MKIAVATMDGLSISAHLGRSKSFLVYEVGEDCIGEPVVLANHFTAHAKGECGGEHGYHAQGEPHSHAGILAALEGCSVVIARGMGRRVVDDLKQHGITPIMIDQNLSPEEAVRRRLAGGLEPAIGFCKSHT